MSLFESLVSLCIKSVNIVFCYSFSLSWISLWLKCHDHNLKAPVRLSRHYWRYAAIYGELNSPQIGADSHEFLVKIFAREYHGITTTFSAHLHQTSTILFEFLRHTYAILRYLFDITMGLYEFVRVLYVYVRVFYDMLTIRYITTLVRHQYDLVRYSTTFVRLCTT